MNAPASLLERLHGLSDLPPESLREVNLVRAPWRDMANPDRRILGHPESSHLFQHHRSIVDLRGRSIVPGKIGGSQGRTRWSGISVEDHRESSAPDDGQNTSISMLSQACPLKFFLDCFRHDVRLSPTKALALLLSVIRFQPLISKLAESEYRVLSTKQSLNISPNSRLMHIQLLALMTIEPKVRSFLLNMATSLEKPR